MRRLIILVLRVLVLFACNRINKIPSGILPPDVMEAVLWDMMRADILVTNYMMVKDPLLVRDSAVKKLYHSVYSIHNITEEKFNKSFLYYKRNPELLKQVMDSISRQPITDTASLKADTVVKGDTLSQPDTLKRNDSLGIQDTHTRLPLTPQSKPRTDSSLFKKKRKIVPVSL
ncbi:MAG: DUF4296 domain-containing protein [Chitinophagaceae bacterium]|nr:DUF4296 domain-containing protein [Chitinophagaceae bacterium]